MKDEYAADVASTGGAISTVKTKGNNSSSADEDEERYSAHSHRRFTVYSFTVIFRSFSGSLTGIIWKYI